MKVHEIMTAHARCVGPDNTLVEAAGLMRELDVGALPVCENDAVAGIVTDRDLVVRGTAEGKDPHHTAVRDVMSPGIIHVFADQAVEEAVRIMEEKQVRRLPVLNRGGGLVGIVSLGDIATSSNPAFSGMALRDVSQPSHPSSRQRRLTELSEPARMPTVPGVRRGPAGRGSRSSTRGTRATAKKTSSRKNSKRRATSARKPSSTSARGKSAGRGSSRRSSARSRR